MNTRKENIKRNVRAYLRNRTYGETITILATVIRSDQPKEVKEAFRKEYRRKMAAFEEMPSFEEVIA